jgi:putative flippase GtrA
MMPFRYYNFLRKFLAQEYPGFFNFLSRYKDKIKFIISGFLATIVNLFFLFIFFQLLNLKIIYATSLSWFLAFIISFNLQKFWTFRNFSTKKIPKQLFYYIISLFISLILNARWMYLLVESLELHYLLAQIIVIIVLGLLNYFFYKFLIFNEKK